MIWHRRVAKYVAIAVALHFVLDAVVFAAAVAVIYFGLGCAALRCEPGSSCSMTHAELEEHRAMTTRRNERRDAVLSIRAGAEYRRLERARRR